MPTLQVKTMNLKCIQKKKNKVATYKKYLKLNKGVYLYGKNKNKFKKGIYGSL